MSNSTKPHLDHTTDTGEGWFPVDDAARLVTIFIALLREHGERGTNPMLQRVIRGWTPAGGCAKSIASGASKTPITAQGRKNQMLVVCSTADDFVRSAI